MQVKSQHSGREVLVILLQSPTRPHPNLFGVLCSQLLPLPHSKPHPTPDRTPGTWAQLPFLLWCSHWIEADFEAPRTPDHHHSLVPQIYSLTTCTCLGCFCPATAGPKASRRHLGQERTKPGAVGLGYKVKARTLTGYGCAGQTQSSSHLAKERGWWVCSVT